MHFDQLKRIEHSIAIAQAELGVLRARIKREENITPSDGQDIQKELDELLSKIDNLQKTYINTKP